MGEKQLNGFIVPRRGPRLTLLAAAWGALILFWLSPEDRAVWPMVILGAGAAVLMVLLVTAGRLAGRTLSERAFTLGMIAVGGLSGALAGPVTALLMLIKTAMHSHAYPDYPLAMIAATLARVPAWAIAGALVGVGIALLRFGRHTR